MDPFNKEQISPASPHFPGGAYRAPDPTHQTQKQRLDALRAELAEKRAANIAAPNAHGPSEEELLQRDIEIEDKRAEAFSQGLIEEQLLECKWPGIGRCLFRTPSDTVYREFAHKSGMLAGKLVNDIAIHERLAGLCALAPDGPTFLALSRRFNAHAPVQVGNVMLERMGDRAAAEGK